MPNHQETPFVRHDTMQYEHKKERIIDYTPVQPLRLLTVAT
jgi:hypothetical protein